jgi:hypothetical protein
MAKCRDDSTGWFVIPVVAGTINGYATFGQQARVHALE